MTDYLKNIIAEYSGSEITSVMLYDRALQAWFNLFMVIELVPFEQEASPLIKGEKPEVPADRIAIDDNYTIYIARVTSATADAAVASFNTPSVGFVLKQGTKLDCHVRVFPNVLLEAEPPAESPLSIDKQTEYTYGTILPYRHTDFRVWAKIDREKKWLNAFTPYQKDAIINKAGILSIRHLGFDLSRMPEHLGNIYLCGCNPYLRRYDSSLLDYKTDLLISFYEREGKTIIGKKLILEDKRAGNIGFTVEKIISSKFERIQLPHFPDLLYTKIYDLDGGLIENHIGKWINYSVGIHMQTSLLNLTVKDGDKTKTLEIPKYSSEKPVEVGSYDNSLIYYLKGQQRNKEIEELENNKEFIFFPGGDADKEKATNVIGEIINRASERCILLDPYFGAGDLLYAYIVRNTSLPIQIISSTAFLKGPANFNSDITHGESLDRALKQFREKFPLQKIECRILKGRNKSPLHDRYIVTDNAAYLLGSSFNEFGSRATSLIKVPAPELLIKKALAWWSNDDETILIEEYVKSKPTKDESTNRVGTGTKVFQSIIRLCKKLFKR